MNNSAAVSGLEASQAIYRRVSDNVGQVVTGQHEAVRMLLAALASGGHILLEDYPGTGKTTMAKAVARSIGAAFSRVQFTPDLLPSDILGVSVFDQHEQRFNFRPGPIFTNFLLADEINRASPRTQSALLEAMAEEQVTVEGTTHLLDAPFLVIATQNPVEFRGTYPLPEAQMDRFMVRLRLGYLDAESELAMVSAQADTHPLDRVEACASLDDIRTLRQGVKGIDITPALKRYAIDIVRATRDAPQVQLGAGPRASIAFLRMAQALALFDGLAYVTPDHLHACASAVVAHRIAVEAEARFAGVTGERIVGDILDTLAVPV